VGSTLRGRERVRAHERMIDEGQGCAKRARTSAKKRKKEDRGLVDAYDKNGCARFESEKEQWSVNSDHPSAVRKRERERERTIPVDSSERRRGGVEEKERETLGAIFHSWKQNGENVNRDNERRRKRLNAMCPILTLHL